MRTSLLTLTAASLALSACSKSAPTPAPTPAARGGAAGARGAAPTPATPGDTTQRPAGAPAGGPGGAAGGPGGAGEPTPRPFAQVITSRATTKKGVFNVHQVGSTLYFEIPAKELSKDFVITTVLAGTTTSVGIGGTLGPDRVIRFERRGNRVDVRDVSFANVATDTTLLGKRAMDLITQHPIIATLNVAAYGADSAPVVDVTRMFTGGVQEFTASGQRAQVAADRSYIAKFAAFSRNVNVTAVQTFTPQAAPGGAAGGGRGGAPGNTTESYTFSIVRLPDEPMMPRLNDARVGFFGETKTDFGSPELRVTQRRYIARWRLECSDQKVGELCVPKKPITYYVDPATPAWLVPFVKAGIEEWQSAFEMAGFSKGIVAADAPNDPDFSGEDATVAMVRWLPSAVANAVGPSTTDPRTGEIIDADVQMYHNIMDLQRNWYFTQVGHLDPRAQKFPFPKDLMGRLVQFVVSHEVGHTLGFPHNFKASSMYPLDSLRSKTWVAKMGHSPSVMDYARFNYVAQPEDGIALEDLVPRVGPYDRYAVMWGYKPIPGARTPEAELPTLDQWARQQDETPWFRFASDAGAGGADPGEQSEAIGDADAVRATTLGFKNIERLMKIMEPAATANPLDDHSMLRTTYGNLMGQWATEAAHVTRIVGGVDKQEKRLSQPGPVYTPVSKARQQAAMKFLNEQVFSTPKYLILPEVLRKIEFEGNLNRITSAQARSLSSLVANAKMQRMVELEELAANKREVYTLGEMLTDLRRGLWSEIYAGKPIDAYRRRLQAAYLSAMADKINPAPAPAAGPGGPGGGGAGTRDFRGLLKDEMRVLDRELAAAIGRTSDRTTRAHLQDARDEITKMLKVD
jgi:hypothetical protein